MGRNTDRIKQLGCSFIILLGTECHGPNPKREAIID